MEIQVDPPEESASDAKYTTLQEINDDLRKEIHMKDAQIDQLREEIDRLNKLIALNDDQAADTVDKPQTVSPADTVCEPVSSYIF